MSVGPVHLLQPSHLVLSSIQGPTPKLGVASSSAVSVYSDHVTAGVSSRINDLLDLHLALNIADILQPDHSEIHLIQAR